MEGAVYHAAAGIPHWLSLLMMRAETTQGGDRAERYMQVGSEEDET